MGEKARRRSVGVALLVLVALVVAVANVAWRERATLRIRWKLHEVPVASKQRLTELMSEIADVGSQGLAALEDLAFSDRVAEPGTHETLVRQAALDELAERARFGDVGGRELGDMLLPFVGRALGLDRPQRVRKFVYFLTRIFSGGSASLDEAAVRALLEDPDEEFAGEAEEYLAARRACVEVRASATRTCRFGPLRERIMQHLLDEDAPSLPDVLEAAYADDEGVRVAAAALRWRRHDGTRYGTLVHALRSGSSLALKWSAYRALDRGEDRRLVLALGRIAASEAGELSKWTDRTLAQMLYDEKYWDEPRAKDHWLRYVETYAKDLPPQIDPESDAPIEPPVERR